MALPPCVTLIGSLNFDSNPLLPTITLRQSCAQSGPSCVSGLYALIPWNRLTTRGSRPRRNSSKVGVDAKVPIFYFVAVLNSAPVQVLIFLGIVVAEFLVGQVKRVAAILGRPMLWPVALFFLPKLNLISFKNETAGIRIDDFVLLFVAALLVNGWILKKGFAIDRVALIGLGVVATFCASNLLNAGHSSILYSLRLLEYLLFFWAGVALAKSGHDFTRLVKTLIGVNCALIFLQSAELIGGFSADGYEAVLGRPFGLCNHPAEMGALLNLLFAALVFGQPVKFWNWNLLVLACVFITGSRSALLTHCLLTLVYVYQHSENKMKFALRSATVTGLLLTVLTIIPNPTSQRSGDTFSSQNLEAFNSVYEKLPNDKVFTGFAEGGDVDEAPENVDASWYARGFKWAHVIKVLLNASWINWIFGIGPGAVGPSLDGGWLRLFAEAGIVGAFSFVLLLRHIARLSMACAMAVFALSVNMLMIDSHIAYKVMAFLFLMAGYVRLYNSDYPSISLQRVTK